MPPSDVTGISVLSDVLLMAGSSSIAAVLCQNACDHSLWSRDQESHNPDHEPEGHYREAQKSVVQHIGRRRSKIRSLELRVFNNGIHKPHERSTPVHPAENAGLQLVFRHALIPHSGAYNRGEHSDQ